jgi:fimbrial isopeptide formation D2 family protein/uncharacterized repeat protein (TIGR01451 family)
MTTRANSFRAFPVLLAFLINLVIGPLAPLAQTSPVAALSGTFFNATDGNLVDNSGPEVDWCTPAPNRDEGFDTPSGATDTSFSSSNNKEDSDVPTLSLGTIPNNKDDLLREYVASETINGDLFVYLAWVRADSTGTSTIDFEFNQSAQVSSNGVTKVRTDGDLLVTFDFQANPGSQGGYAVNLELRTWSSGTADQPDPTSSPVNTGKWINEVDLDDLALAEGSVNGSDVTDCVSGDVTLATGTFGEAALNLSDILGGSCKSFGSLFTKSRSSNSFSADLKDRIDPLPVNFNTCGQITILKQDEHQQPLGGATFSVTPNPFTGSGSLSVADNQAPDDNAAAGTIHLSDVEPGTYTVCETAAPAGYIIASPACAPAQQVVDNGSVTFGPFTNGLGDITWEKVDAQSGAKVCCATFTLTGIAGAAIGFGPLTVTDNGANDADLDPGELRVNELKLGTYRITETVPPTGYDLPSPAFKDVVLSAQTASAASAFSDPPRRDPSVTKTAVLDPVVAGHDASFTITVTAGGVGNSTGVVLSDVNPVGSGHTWAVTGANAASCTDLSIAPGETLTCNFGTILNGQSKTVTITTTALQADCANGIANTATITADADVNTNNNSASDSITVLCPNPGVTKTAVLDPIVFGDPASFTIVVTAGGSGDATNVVLSDINPVGSGHTWAVSGANAAACPDLSIAPGETLTCNFGTIAAGQSRTVIITATSNADDCEDGIANTATITAADDVDTSNNSASDGITVLCPNPGVEKTANVDPITAGDPASFTITVTASGSGDSENVVLSDLNPLGSGHTWAVTGANAASCTDLSIAPGETLTCNFGTIPNGQSRTVIITATSNPNDCEEGIANTAAITADADVDDSDNESSDSIAVECPDIKVEKTGSGTVNATDQIFFEITVSNIGDGDAKGFTFSDTLPSVATGWALVAPVEPGCGLIGLALSCSKALFEAGDSFTLRVEATSAIADCHSLPNTASASATNEDDGDLANNSDGHTIVVECPNLTPTKVADAAVVSAGSDIGFTITVSNANLADTGTAYDVDLNDPLPAGSALDWAIVPAYAGPGTCQILGAPGAETLSCHFGNLGPGASASVHVVSDTAAADCGLYHNVATITSDNHSNLTPSADTTVECPGMNVTKVADKSPIDAGETASYTMVVWNSGPGTAFGATFHDELPDDVNWSIQLLNGDADDACSVASSAIPGQPVHWSADCQFHDLPVTSMANGKQIRISGVTDRADCGTLDNDAFADADNDDRVGPAEASITVKCPRISIVKVNNQPNPVLPGTVVSYTVTVTVSDGPANAVVVKDVLPAGLDAPTSISNGGSYTVATRTITWNLGQLANGSYALTYQAAVSAGTAQGATLTNLAVVTSPNSQCPSAASIAPECDDDSTVTVRVPALVIDKSASTEVVHFVFDSDGDVLSVTPATVTWTLSYTLTNGPVTNAVITDPLPSFLSFVSASNGGTLTAGVITWNLGTLTTSGSVSFVTTVNPAAPETSPILNVATIDSSETAPDQGQDSIRVTSESELAGTPAPSVPNTALVFGPNGEPISIPVELMVVLLLGSLGTLALANVRAARRRR